MLGPSDPHRLGWIPGLLPRGVLQALARRGALPRRGLRRALGRVVARGEHGDRPEARRRHRDAARPVRWLSRAALKVERSVELSSLWAERCYAAHARPDQALFGIVQGGMHLDLRLRSLRHLEEIGDFPGYGIGGYSVGRTTRRCSSPWPRSSPSTCRATSPATSWASATPPPSCAASPAAWTCSTACCPRARHAPAPRSRARVA